jgi:hypothetical protein
MRTLLVAATLAVIATSADAAQSDRHKPLPAKQQAAERTAADPCGNAVLRDRISVYQQEARQYRRLRGLAAQPSSVPPAAAGCAYVRWAHDRWRDRAWREKRLYRQSVVNRLERGLRGTPMAGTGAVLERHGRRWGVSPFFMAAVAATESSLGAAACRNNRKNVWGLASCVNSWPVPYFHTWDDAVGFYARFLRQRWPSATSPFHYYGYAANSQAWGRRTAYWMRLLFGVGPSVRYQ